MSIKRLSVENFKGIAQTTDFELKPITIFIGANSSGKSSVIHALATLSQTLKLGNSAPSLVLDDDFAHVHLGRFTEIAHSRSYKDAIVFSLELPDVSVEYLNDDKRSKTIKGTCKATYEFRSTKRTQEVYVACAELTLGDMKLSIKRGVKKPYAFHCEVGTEPIKYPLNRYANFLFRVGSTPKEFAVPWINVMWFLQSAQNAVEKALRDTLYLGPFRQSPLRRYPFRGSSAAEVGAQGEATITLLATEYVQSKDRAHFKQINKWLSHMGLAKNVDLTRIGTSDLFDVSITLNDGNKLPIADLGYGLSQVLPVLAQCSFAKNGSTLLFEQPELHLHERAARKLADVFIETNATKKTTVVIETHSRDLVGEMFNAIRQKKIAIDDIAIYRVDRQEGASQYKRIGMTFEDNHLEVEDPWADAVA